MTTPIPEVTRPDFDADREWWNLEEQKVEEARLAENAEILALRAENEELKRQLATMRQSRDYHYSVRRDAEPMG